AGTTLSKKGSKALSVGSKHVHRYEDATEAHLHLVQGIENRLSVVSERIRLCCKLLRSLLQPGKDLHRLSGVVGEATHGGGELLKLGAHVLCLRSVDLRDSSSRRSASLACASRVWARDFAAAEAEWPSLDASRLLRSASEMAPCITASLPVAVP